MFTTMSNITFNNNLFSDETIQNMHPSMARLYQFVAEAHQLSGQSALARKLGETPQTVKNWEGTRGISEGGALKAQLMFGCNANWLLGRSDTNTAPAQPGAVLIAADHNGGWQWPFWSVSPKDYALLTLFVHLLFDGHVWQSLWGFTTPVNDATLLIQPL